MDIYFDRFYKERIYGLLLLSFLPNLEARCVLSSASSRSFSLTHPRRHHQSTTKLTKNGNEQLSIHRGPALIADHGIITRSGSTALQYKLEEAGAVFSVKGLGRGFL